MADWLSETRAAFRDVDDPNGNDPVESAPGTVGPPSAVPGDPHGVEVVGESPGAGRLPPVGVAAWSGWPAEWSTPNWQGHVQSLTDTAWACLDSNASILSTMPPYLIGQADSLSADWLHNPDPDQYASWEEFAKQLFWDYQAAGESFVLCTARYATGWPARFHVVPPWHVDADIGGGGMRRYAIGERDVTPDVLHVRYTSHVGDAHGHGPLEVGGPRLVAASALARYAYSVANGGGVPNSVLLHPSRLNAQQAADLQTQWVNARVSQIGLPAVLSGGVDFKTLSFSPKDLALVELGQWNESRIAVLLGVPPFCMALPSGGDPMTYSNVSSLFDYRWRAGLRPIAQAVMSALSGWALPRGTTVELDRDEFIRPDPYVRAQAAEKWVAMGALTADEVRQRERFAELSGGPETIPQPEPEPVPEELIADE
jgi:HK97 family phage portal protein